MEGRPEKSREELLGLLSNCVLALALAEDEGALKLARYAADQHVEELNRRFPGWQDELHALAHAAKA
jgi:hypothetical protein